MRIWNIGQIIFFFLYVNILQNVLFEASSDIQLCLSWDYLNKKVRKILWCNFHHYILIVLSLLPSPFHPNGLSLQGFPSSSITEGPCAAGGGTKVKGAQSDLLHLGFSCNTSESCAGPAETELWCPTVCSSNHPLCECLKWKPTYIY